MVKIIDISEEDAETTEEETSEEEDDDEKLPDPPDPPDPPLAPSMFPSLEPSAPEASGSLRAPRVISPIVRVGLSRPYVSYLLRNYGHCLEVNRSGQEAQGSIITGGLSKWAAEQLARAPNGNSHSHFACTISAPDNADRVMEDDRSTEGTASIFIAGNSTQATEELVEKDEGNKTECDKSTKEKSNGVSEKVQLATAASGAKAELLSSPDLSECELSDVSDSLAPPDYETVQADMNQEYAPSDLKDCPWTKNLTQKLGADIDPELTETAVVKEPSETSDEGEAAALPASSVVKDCREQWIDDDRLFNLTSEAPASCSSSAVSERVPSPVSSGSPASPATERRRIKLENRQRARQDAERTMTRFIFVPTEKIGRIVGKGGRKVKEIEKVSGAKIKIQQKKSANPVTQITLTGTLEEISKADEEICVVIRNFKRARSGEPTTASVSSVEEMDLKRLLRGIKNQVLDSEKRCRKRAE